MEGRHAAAIEQLSRWKWLPLVSGRVYELIGTAELLSGGSGRALPIFRKARNQYLHKPASLWEEVLKILWSTGRYRDGLFYSNHIREHLKKERSLHFFRAGFHAGMNALQPAIEDLGMIAPDKDQRFSTEISALKAEINRRQAGRKYTVLYDRENLPLADITFTGESSIRYESVQPVIQNPSGDLLAEIAKDPYAQADLTIDFRIQNAALNSLGQYAGAIVLLNVKTGEILAAASNLKGVGTEYPPGTAVAFTTQYEPGSIIKMITLAGALENNIDLSSIVPFECEGAMPLSGNRILYCWKGRHQVKDMDQATAVSCNTAFARIGLTMNPVTLIENLRSFGFDSRLQGNGFFPLELGKILQSEADDQVIGNLSIGLDALQITPLHAALLAAGIANKGACISPRLLRHYRNVIGIPYNPQGAVPFRRFMSEKTAALLTRAMERVVQDEDGTGRRAAIPGFPIAMKTGTAGDSKKGYTALLIGFGPIPEPKIAFAIVIEHCGKAEFEGARITKLFLESIRGYIK